MSSTFPGTVLVECPTSPQRETLRAARRGRRSCYMNFQALCIVMVAGACGPLLSAATGSLVPVIVGELAAGAVLGTGGLRIVDPSQPTLVFLANGGFVMLLFAAGMHVPVRSLGRSVKAGFAGAAASFALGVVVGVAVHGVFGGPTLVYALLMASSSSSVIVPMVQERGLDQHQLARTLAWVTTADALTIFGLPLVLAPSRVAHVLLGAGAVLVALAIITLLALALRGRGWVATLRASSRQRGWALELRVSLIGAFALAAVAQRTGVSLMLAGFSGGLLVAALGGPKRLDRQVSAVAQGLLVPLFFVSLGAQIKVLDLFAHPALLGLTAALIAGAALVHLAVGRGLKHGSAPGLMACAQMGLPASVAQLGLRAHAITPGQAAAIVLAGLGAVAVSALAAGRLPVAATKTAEQPANSDTVPVRWRKHAREAELASAERRLAGQFDADQVHAAVGQWQQAHPRRMKASDVLDAAGLTALPASNVGVARKLSRMAAGKSLPPVLVLHSDDGGPAIVADGYRGVSAGYIVHPKARVAVLEARVSAATVPAPVNSSVPHGRRVRRSHIPRHAA